jgi:hypothetical protein
MRPKLCLLLSLTLLDGTALADDTPTGADAFRRQAEQISDLHALELDQKIVKLKSEIAAETAIASPPREATPAAAETPSKPKPAFHLREIAGIGGRLTALRTPSRISESGIRHC